MNDQIQNLKSNEKKLRGFLFEIYQKFVKILKDELIHYQQETLKKKEILNNNSSLKEQNIQLEKENIQNLELLKLHKQKVF